MKILKYSEQDVKGLVYCISRQEPFLDLGIPQDFVVTGTKILVWF